MFHEVVFKSNPQNTAKQPLTKYRDTYGTNSLPFLPPDNLQSQIGCGQPHPLERQTYFHLFLGCAVNLFRFLTHFGRPKRSLKMSTHFLRGKLCYYFVLKLYVFGNTTIFS